MICLFDKKHVQSFGCPLVLFVPFIVGGYNIFYQRVTDYVFPGLGDTPYETEDERRPRSVYGLSKEQGEEKNSTKPSITIARRL